MGRERYPDPRELTITAEGGGSNGSRVRLWKIELQKFADATGMIVHVHHYPPGTSKWNKIEHRLFCHITQTWRGRPLTDRLAVVELIAATTTTTGLRVESALDTRTYEKGIKVTDAEMELSTSQATLSILNGTTPSAHDHTSPTEAVNVAGVLTTLLTKTEAVKGWLKRHKRFYLHFTPTSAPWLNMVERFFAEITRERIRRGAFTSVAELKEAIMEYLENHNAAAKPFVWTELADEILKKVARAKQALESKH